MPSVCVFCGSNPGSDPSFVQFARRLGEEIANSGRTLVYGGGNVGLMGAMADAALNVGGTVIGVIPRALAEKEVAHMGLTKLHVVESMHTRKALMAELAEGFIVMPGGVGTLEECFEIWTWVQLGFIQKPIGLLNVAHFFDPLLQFLEHVVENQFMRPEHRQMLLVDTDPKSLLSRLSTHQPATVQKWIEREQS